MDLSTNRQCMKDRIINDLRRRKLTEKELDRLIIIVDLLLQQQRGEGRIHNGSRCIQSRDKT